MKKGYIDLEKKRKEYLKKLIEGDKSRVEENRKKIYEGRRLKEKIYF